MGAPGTIAAARERALLDAARAGDEGAYESLVERHRSELHAHCYRMLGSVHDAEDALQDALLRAWRALPRFEGRSSPRSWLYRIATNTCLDAVARRPRRVLPMDHGPPAGPDDGLREPLVETAWVEPYADERMGVEDGAASPEASYERRESMELAFVAALQLLPARQRAALILREVLGFSAQEVADALGTTVASVNSALQRARATIRGRLPERSQQATVRALGDGRVRALVGRYMDAMERGDVDDVLALLAEDATWSMPPIPTWFRGHAALGRFLRDYGLTVRWRHLPAHANGQAAVGCYAWDPARAAWLASVLDVLTLEGERIAAVTAFAPPEVFRGLAGHGPRVVSSRFAAFGLPAELPA